MIKKAVTSFVLSLFATCFLISSCGKQSEQHLAYVGDGTAQPSCHARNRYLVQWSDITLESARSVTRSYSISNAPELPNAMLGIMIQAETRDQSVLMPLIMNFGVLKAPGNQDSDMAYFVSSSMKDVEWNRICLNDQIVDILLFPTPQRTFPLKPDTQYSVHIDATPSEKGTDAATLTATLVLFDASELLGPDDRR